MSKFLSLNAKDLIKAVVLTFITALVTGLYQLIEVGGADIFTWVALKPILITSALAAGSYLLKNLFSNSADQPFKTEGAAPPAN